jgi:hypothetical protein
MASTRGEKSGPAVASKQNNWRWCCKCQCLFFAGIAVCPAGGVHNYSSSGDYSMISLAARRTGSGARNIKSYLSLMWRSDHAWEAEFTMCLRVPTMAFLAAALGSKDRRGGNGATNARVLLIPGRRGQGNVK